MDLRQLRADGEATMEVEDLAGAVIYQDKPADAGENYKPKPVTLTFKGVDSPDFVTKMQAVADFRRKKGGVPQQAHLESDTVEIIAAVTVGWEGVQLGDEMLPFNIGNVRRLYREVPAVLQQANTFLGNRLAFTKAASKS